MLGVKERVRKLEIDIDDFTVGVKINGQTIPRDQFDQCTEIHFIIRADDYREYGGRMELTCKRVEVQ